MSEIDKLREDKARLRAERSAAYEAGRSPHERIIEPLREFVDEPREFKVEAWARLLREQGVDPNGHKVGMWERTWNPHGEDHKLFSYRERYFDRPLTEGEAKLVEEDRTADARLARRVGCGCIAILAFPFILMAIQKLTGNKRWPYG